MYIYIYTFMRIHILNHFTNKRQNICLTFLAPSLSVYICGCIYIHTYKYTYMCDQMYLYNVYLYVYIYK